MKAEQDQEQKIPLSELIDHITMDGNVDAWAKEMIVKMLEPPQPIRAEAIARDVYKGIFVYACGACNALIDYKDRYCRHCGCRIRWD